MIEETTLLFKLPPDLKISFQGLCKHRGVSVSEELRRFMIEQVSGSSQSVASKKPTKGNASSTKLVAPQKPFKNAVQANSGFSDDSFVQAVSNRMTSKIDNKKK
jgi:hypothetical protein